MGVDQAIDVLSRVAVGDGEHLVQNRQPIRRLGVAQIQRGSDVDAVSEGKTYISPALKTCRTELSLWVQRGPKKQPRACTERLSRCRIPDKFQCP